MVRLAHGFPTKEQELLPRDSNQSAIRAVLKFF